MAVVPPPRARSRARPGSLERPVNGRLYRGTWMLVGIPLLIAAFSVSKPQALRPPVPTLPPAFDRTRAAALAAELARLHPDRSPGSRGYDDAADWFAGQLAAYGFPVRRDRFFASIPGRGRMRMQNLIAVVPGQSPQALAVLAHLDNTGSSPGANDNASGIAALVEIARSYTRTGTAAPPGTEVAVPGHTILFVATDGGTVGGAGANRFAIRYRDRVLAAVDLDSIAGVGKARMVFAGDTARGPSPALLETAAQRIVEQTGTRPGRPSALGQLIDLAFPFSLYEQGPLIARGLPGVTLTTAGDRPPPSFGDVPGRLDQIRLAQIGRSAQELLRTLDEGPELVQGTSSYVYFGPRVLRGWALELVLVAALAPFLLAAVDLFARCRRRGIRLAAAVRSYRSRVAFWLWVGAVFELFALVGVWRGGASLPIAPDSSAARTWPVLGLLGLLVLAALGWLVARDRLAPRRPVTAAEELAGQTAALLALSVVALLVIATNPFALVFLLPSLHAWLWLPQVQGRPPWTRAAVFAAGLLGPALLLGSFALRYHLGLDAPWYLAQLTAIHFVKLPSVVIVLAWAAAAAQLAAIAARRYAPYPDARERPRLGPIRRTIRRFLLASRSRRRASDVEREALEG